MWHSLIICPHRHLQMSIQEISGKLLGGLNNWWEGWRLRLKINWDQGIPRVQANSALSSGRECSLLWRVELQTLPWPHATLLHIQSHVGDFGWLPRLDRVQGPILDTMIYILNMINIKGEVLPAPGRNQVSVIGSKVKCLGGHDTKKTTIVNEANTLSCQYN